MYADPNPSIFKQKCKKNLDSYCFVPFFDLFLSFLFDFFIFEKLCKCSFKKVIPGKQKTYLFAILKVTAKIIRIRSQIRIP